MYIYQIVQKKKNCLFTLAHGNPFNLIKLLKFDGVLFSFQTQKKNLLHNLWLGNRFAFHSFVKFVPQGKNQFFFRHITKNLLETIGCWTQA